MPIARVQLPDGRIARLEVPEGTTPEQVSSYASAQFSVPDNKPAAQPSLPSTPEGYNPSGLEAGIAGALSSIIKMGTGLQQRAAESFAGPAIASGYGKLLSMIRPDLAPELNQITATDVGQSAGNVGKDIQNFQQRQHGAAFNIGQFAGDVAPYLAVPGGPVAAGAVSGAFSGFAQPNQGANLEESANQAAMNVGKDALIGAATGGVIKGVSGVASGTVDLGKNLFNMIRNPNAYATNTVENRVGQTLVDNASSRMNLVQGASPEDLPNIPGQQYTIGEANKDAGLIILQRRVAATPEGSRIFAERAQAGQQAIQDQVNKLTTQSTDSATLAALKGRQQGVGQVAEDIANKANENYQAQIEALASSKSPQDASAAVDASLRQTIADATQKKNDIYRSIDPMREAQVDTTKLQETVKDITTPKGQLDITPNELPDNVLGPLKKAFNVPEGSSPNPITIADLQDLRPNLSDAIAQANKDRKGNVVGALTRLKSSIDQTIADFGNSGTTSAAALRAQEAQKYFQNDFAPKFREGGVGAFEQANRSGATQPTATMDKFFRSGAGARESIADLTRVLGDNPNAVQSMQDFAIGKALKETGNNPEKLASWVDKYGEAINGVPGLAEKFGNLQSATNTLSQYQARSALIQKGINSPKDSVIATYLNGRTAKDSMSAIMGSRTSGQDAAKLMNSLKGNQAAIDGAKRAFIDNFSNEQGQITKNPKAFNDFVTKNQDVMKQIFRDDPAQVSRINDIAKSLQLTSQESTLRGVGSDTALKSQAIAKQTGSIISWLAYTKLGAPGRVVANFANNQLQNAASKLADVDFNTLLSQSLLDPELAKTLTMKVTSGNENVVKRRISSYLASAAASSWASNRPM